MKNYLEFINEGMDFVIPFIAVRRSFDQMFPTKEVYETNLIKIANDVYENIHETQGDEDQLYVADCMQDIDESIWDNVMDNLLWEVLSNINENEVPAGIMLKLGKKLEKYIDKKFYSEG